VMIDERLKQLERRYKKMIPLFVGRKLIHYAAVGVTAVVISAPLITASDAADKAAGTSLRNSTETMISKYETELRASDSKATADLEKHLSDLEEFDSAVMLALSKVEQAEHRHYGKRIVIASATTALAGLYLTSERYLSRPQEFAVKTLTRLVAAIGWIEADSPYIPASEARSLVQNLKNLHFEIKKERERTKQALQPFHRANP
jgi:hypothetical protein